MTTTINGTWARFNGEWVALLPTAEAQHATKELLPVTITTRGGKISRHLATHIIDGSERLKAGYVCCGTLKYDEGIRAGMLREREIIEAEEYAYAMEASEF